MASLLRLPPLLLCLAQALSAQLDLPVAPRAAPPGEPLRELPSRQSGNLATGSRGQELDLPAGAVVPGPAPLAPAPAEAVPGLEPADDLGTLRATLETVRALDEPRFAAALERWSSLGPAGLDAARRGIESDALGVLVASARVLLDGGAPEDRLRVAERLRRPLPAPAAVVLLDALVARDPVVATPSFLCELLDHPTAAMRQAAQRVLLARAEPSFLSCLAGRLASTRSDTRLRALEIVARIGGDAALPLVASRLGDPTPRVAAEALRYLALDDGPEAGVLLRERAFAEGVAERGAAHALLALVEREERGGPVDLTLDDVSPLLEALRAGEPIVAGAAAAALAGIGFRNPASPATAWLDLEVPHTLVRLGSGAEFHRDFSTLQPIALRRLGLISGENLGTDGLAWRSWWTESARGFRARRAVIAVEPGDEDQLCVELRRGEAAAVRLAGARSARAEEPGMLLVRAEECTRLVELLRAEGVLSLERLPRGRGNQRQPGLVLAIQVGAQEKRFDFGATEVPAWVERIAAAAAELAAEHAWQRFPDRSRHATQRAFVEAEGPWWTEERTPEERARRLSDLILAALPRAAPGDRQAGLDELRRQFALAGVAGAADVEPLTALLAAEEQYGGRLEEIVDLILVAADGRLTAEQSGALVALCARHGEAALGALGRVLHAAGPAAVRAASLDHEALVRRAAARAAAEDPSPEATELLCTLLEDPDWTVGATAIEGLGSRGTPEVRALLAARASDAPPLLRPAYLRAVGRAGGEDARDVLVLALAEPDPKLQLAAVEGLAELADPGSAAVLVSVLARGQGAEWSEPARRGLARIGAPAWPQLLRVASSSKSRGQRDATLLLSEQGVAEAAPLLITLLGLDPGDALVAEELAVLSCVDHRQASDPERAWWDWWDLVVHDDALAWFRAGLERAGLRAPEAAELAAADSLEAALFLVDVIAGDHPWPLVERARRELGRFLGQPLELLPEDVAARARHADELRLAVRARLEAGARGSTER